MTNETVTVATDERADPSQTAGSSPHRELTVMLRASDGRETRGKLTIRTLSWPARLGRGVRAAALLLLLTLLSIGVPLLHFLLVPLGLLCTAIAFSVGYSATEVVVDGSGSCPSCGHAVAVSPQRVKGDFETVCKGCGRRLTVRLPAKA